jgi:hypothetical protein
LYYTSGLSGSGHLVLGISICNAFRRKRVQIDYTILSPSPQFVRLADRFQIPHVEIPFEDETQLSQNSCQSSQLYRTVMSIDPDVLIVDLFWFTLHYFLRELRCRKIFLSRQVSDIAFHMRTRVGELMFDQHAYDLALAIEPFRTEVPLQLINPIVIRNHEEILPRERAMADLKLTEGKQSCLFAFNGNPGEFERLKKVYSYLEEEGWQVVYSTNFQGGLFPVVDYFNAFDLLICGAGYNAFWEAVYFQKEAIFLPFLRRFEDQRRRVDECQEYAFEKNGADQLVDMILGL